MNVLPRNFEPLGAAAAVGPALARVAAPPALAQAPGEKPDILMMMKDNWKRIFSRE